jgi:hypothetical protein
MRADLGVVLVLRLGSLDTMRTSGAFVDLGQALIVGNTRLDSIT